MLNIRNFFLVSLASVILSSNLYASNEFIDARIKEAQTMLPMVISENFILEEIDINEKEKSLDYKTTFTDMAKEQLEASRISELIAPSMIKFMCNDKLALAILNDNYSIKFNYFDKYGDLYNFTRVSGQDCINFRSQNK